MRKDIDTGAIESENSSISEGNRVPMIETENSTISHSILETGTTDVTGDGSETSQSLDCRKYFPTAALTLSVPCE